MASVANDRESIFQRGEKCLFWVGETNLAITFEQIILSKQLTAQNVCFDVPLRSDITALVFEAIHR